MGWIMKFNLLFYLMVLLSPGLVLAETSKVCSQVVSIDSLDGILYKPDNLHGGRGPTLLVQNPVEWTGKRKLVIRDLNCKIISAFGLWQIDWPYGARYYERTGGGKHTATQLVKLAAESGSRAILVQGRGNKWIKIDSPLKRQGNLLQ